MSNAADPGIGKMLDEDGVEVENIAPIDAPGIGVEVTGEDVTITNLNNITGGDEGVVAQPTAEDFTLENAGTVAGGFNGVNTIAEDTEIINLGTGTISSDSRAINFGEDGASLFNAGGLILGTADQRNGTVYVDGNVDDASLTNQGVIDGGAGNIADGISVQVGVPGGGTVSDDIEITNLGTINARGTAPFDDDGRVTANGSSGVRFFNGAEVEEVTVNGSLTNVGSILSEATAGFLGGLVVEDGVAFNGEIQNVGEISGVQNGLYIGNAHHDLAIENTGAIQSGSRAVNLDGDNVSFANLGLITGTGDQRNGTFYLDGSADNITVLNEGAIDAGTGNTGSGISVQVGASSEDDLSDDITIINNGGVQGRASDGALDSAGVRFFQGAGTEAPVVNASLDTSGFIISPTNAAILIEPGIEFNGTINNTGQIIGQSGTAIDASQSIGDIEIVSTGLVDGEVLLGDGDDLFDTGAGQFNNAGVDLAHGDDVYVTAVFDEMAKGGGGTDIIDFSGATVGLSINLDPGTTGDGEAVEEFGFAIAHLDQPVASLTTDQSPADIVAEAVAGNLYYNIHTNSFPGGEIRGQLDTLVSDETAADGTRIIVLDASLDASQEPGPTGDSLATGEGQVTITVSPSGAVTYSSSLSVDGIQTPDLLPVSGVSSIHLHNAPAGVNGPVILDVVQDAGGDVDGNALDMSDDGDVFAQVVQTTDFTGFEEIIGSSQDDTILSAGAAGNVISGGDGNDFIAGAGGTDMLDGGEGIDTNSFVNIGAEVVADLMTGSAAYQLPTGATVFENFGGFENLDGSANSDQLFGDGSANELTGNDGDDLLVGRGGDDTLAGGLGDDIVRDGGGNDVSDGGEGVDTADFSDIGVDVDVSLARGNGQYVVNGNMIQDELSNFENLTGSANNDTLEGDAGDNLIAGGAGEDHLLGGDGDDILRGDAIGSGEAIMVSVTNTLDEGGTFLTPIWFGFHDGSTFDAFTIGEPASFGLERLTEDGSIEGIAAEFNAQTEPTVADATIIGGAGVPGPIDRGETASFALDIDPGEVGQGFFTWATMIIPSNDAFLAVPDDALADPIFTADGEFLGPITIQRFGSDVLDGGTEANTEVDAAFLDQLMRDAGTPEDMGVALHEGFNGSEANPTDTPINILGGTTASGAIIDPIEGDFTRDGGSEQLLEIVIDRVPGAADTLNGGQGDDTLEGGQGLDTFVFEQGTGHDMVADFVAGEDGEFLDISDFGLADFAAVQAAASQEGDDTVIDLGGDDRVTLQDVQLGELVAGNFILEDDMTII